MNPQNAEKFALQMNRYRPEYLDGYPSIIELFTRYLENRKLASPVKLRAIFCHSEYLNDWQRHHIESFWKSKCFDWYGMEERVVLGLECEKHEELHLCPDFGVTEFIENGPDGFKKIIATSLTNFVMPFIRYETGDVGKPSSNKCTCGRNFPMVILGGGRKRNFAIAKDSSFIPMVNVDIPFVADNVLQFQFLQEKPGELYLFLVRKDGFKDADCKKIKAKLYEKFGKNMDVIIKFTNTLQKTSNNKTPVLIQAIKEAHEVLDFSETIKDATSL
jgi:phenylacetate-CoA ligase